MNRRFLTILLAFALACQTCLAGYAVCSEGGCCHTESEAVHDDHDHGEVHDHSTIVPTAVPHSCECTDRAIEAADAIASKRDEAATTTPAPVIFADLLHRSGPSFGAAYLAVRLRPPPEAALIDQLAVVRATRLLL